MKIQTSRENEENQTYKLKKSQNMKTFQQIVEDEEEIQRNIRNEETEYNH